MIELTVWLPVTFWYWKKDLAVPEALRMNRDKANIHASVALADSFDSLQCP